MKDKGDKIKAVNKAELVDHLVNLGAKVLKFNSNNAWGFGGAMGQRYILKNNLTVTIAKTGERHGEGTSFVRVDFAGKFGIIDSEQTTKAFTHVYNFVNDNIE